MEVFAYSRAIFKELNIVIVNFSLSFGVQTKLRRRGQVVCAGVRQCAIVFVPVSGNLISLLLLSS
jgi:hypothetical protein